MRGAPQRGLLRLINRIRSRTSCGTQGRPGMPRPIFHVQQAKALTMLGDNGSALTIVRADFQSLHTRRNQTQKIRSAGVSFNRFGAERRKTASCCRKARFSSRNWAEVLSIEGEGAEHGEQASLRRPMEQMNVDQLQRLQIDRIIWRDS